MPDGLRLALTTFTVLPVRGPAQVERRTAGLAMSLAPAVGLLLALPAVGLLWLVQGLTPPATPLLACVLAVTVLAVLTRGLHLDGLADTVDGLASYRPPEQALRVMRAPDLGPLGMAAVLLVLLVQVTALLACVQGGRGTSALLLAVVVGRLAVTAACTSRTPAATTTGLGATVAGTVPRGVPLVLALVVAAVAGVHGALSAPPTSTDAGAVVAAGRPLLAVATGLLVAYAVRRHAVRRLGGVTGDVLGALLELSTAATLVVLALDLPLPI